MSNANTSTEILTDLETGFGAWLEITEEAFMDDSFARRFFVHVCTDEVFALVYNRRTTQTTATPVMGEALDIMIQRNPRYWKVAA